MATFQQPGGAGPARPKVRPSAWWYLAPPLVFIASAAIAVTLAITSIAPGFDALTKSLVEFTPPANGTVTLKDGDTETIYLKTEANGIPLAPAAGVSADDLSCRATAVSGETSVTVGDTFDLTFTQSNDKYQALKEFTANGSGDYTVHCTVAGAPGAQLALGKKIGLLRLLGGTFGAIAAFLAGCGIAIGSFVLILVLRIRSKRRAQGPPSGPTGPSGQPVWTPPQPQPPAGGPAPPSQPQAPPPQWPPPDQGPQWPPAG
ncbi:MAG: hypothetical protein U0R70_11770 [Solirubrobacteraceae bacterium]